MGDCIIRVKPKPIITDGITYYDAVYAYKPWTSIGRHELNDKLSLRHCGATFRAWDKKTDAQRRNVLVNYHGSIFLMKHCGGAFWDYAFDKPPVGKVLTPYHRPRIITMFSPRTNPEMEDAL